MKGHFIKNHLCVFVNGLVENPAFNSQSKEALTTKETQFGSSPKISDAGLKALERSEIVDRWGGVGPWQRVDVSEGYCTVKKLGLTATRRVWLMLLFSKMVPLFCIVGRSFGFGFGPTAVC